MSRKLHHETGVTSSADVAGKWFPYGAGIDCHRDMLWGCVLQPIYDTGRQKRDTAKFDTTPVGLKCLREWLEERVPEGQRRVLVESTSTYHFPVLWALKDWTRIVINPMLVGSAKRKTDRWDAQTLAHHCMAGTFPAYVLPTWEELALRACYRRWLKVGATITRSTNALKTRMCMFAINPEFNVHSKSGWRVFSAVCRGEMPALTDDRVKGAAGLRALSSYIKGLPPAVVALNNLQLLGVEALRLERIAAFDAALAAAPLGEMELLLTVPFIRPLSALCFLSEVGFDPRRRFRCIKGIVSYSGFDPSKRVSADVVTSHMPTCGARHLRNAFLQVAAAALVSRGPLGTYGQAVAARTGKRGWQAGRNAVGRKLIRWCASVLFSREPFKLELDHGWKVEASEFDPSFEAEIFAEDVGGDGGGDDCGPPWLDEGVAAAAGRHSLRPEEDQGDQCEGPLGNAPC